MESNAAQGLSSIIRQLNLEDVISTDEDPEDLFELLEQLGEGNFGQVFKALHKTTGNIVAVKIVPVSSEIQSLRKEISILKQCKNPYIVQYYGSYVKDNDLWLILEYCNAGSVSDIIKITKRTLNEIEIASILQAVLKGLEYLHDTKKIHRDIKAGNILLEVQGNAKLADFGVSAQLAHTYSKKNTLAGTPYWMSPEVLMHSEYNKKTDIWSLGITAIEMAEGDPPYAHIQYMRAMFVIQKKPAQGLTQPEKWSPEFNKFVSRCLTIDPKRRPTAKELLLDPFIQKSKGPALLSELVANSLADIEAFRMTQNEEEEDDGENEGLQTFVGVKKAHQGSGTIQQVKQEEGEEVDIGNSGTLVLVEDPHSSQQLPGEEPDFMKYIKNMNVNYMPADYIQQHFAEEEEDSKPVAPHPQPASLVPAKEEAYQIPKEFESLTSDALQSNIVKLKIAKQAELETISARYDEKIEHIEQAMKALKERELRQLKAQQSQQQSNQVIVVQDDDLEGMEDALVDNHEGIRDESRHNQPQILSGKSAQMSKESFNNAGYSNRRA